MQQRLLYLPIATLVLFITAGTSPAQAQDTNGVSPIGTMDTTGYPYDILVDSSLAADDAANMKFRTLQAAYAAAPAGTAAKPTVIGIKPDVYQITGGVTTPGLTITKNYITLLGLTDDHRKVVLADNRGNKQGAGTDSVSDNGYVVVVNATGFSAINLTFLNYCNINYEYPGNPAKNLTRRSGVITQAVAIQANGDKHVYKQVAFLSRLDTTFMWVTRAYFKKVFIEGTVDFIGGGAIQVWEDSFVSFPEGGGNPAVTGSVFINTTFSGASGMVFYKGYPSAPVALINCVVPVSTPSARVAWTGSPAQPRPNLYSLTYHVRDAGGQPAHIADSSDASSPSTYLASRELSEQEVLAFNPWNLLRATPDGTADDWDPAGVKDTYAAQGSLIYRMSLSGANPSLITGRTGAAVSATVGPARVPDKTITWSTPSPLVTLSSTTGSSITVTAQNPTEVSQYVPITATAANGFYATAWAYAQPRYIDPPLFTSLPKVGAPVNSKVTVSYRLNLSANRINQSQITWSICDDASGSNARQVAVSRDGLPLETYTLTMGDIGKYLRAGIKPKAEISDPGPEVFAYSAAPIVAQDLKSTTVDPNFRNVVTTPVSTYVSGLWTLLGSWTSSSGSSLVNGYGVRVAAQGSALLYQQDSPYGDMQVDVAMSPEKTAGTGFGSPGSAADATPPGYIQNADIYIKYDPRTKNGYSVRFWRAKEVANSCYFQLFQHTNGELSPLGPAQLMTSFFKPDTYMTLKVAGTAFTVTAHNSTDTAVMTLQATVAQNQYGGAGVRWSGTTPSGNSIVFSQFRISYPGTVKLSTSATLTKLSSGYQATVTVKNTGASYAQNVQLTAATLGAAAGSALPVPLGSIAPGGTASTIITFPASAGASGTAVVERISGAYTGGSFAASFRASLP